MIKGACLLFSGCTYDVSTRCKICFILRLFANFFSLKTQPFPQKVYKAALKLTDLWITRLLFDLNYKFINRSFASSPG